MKEDMTYQEIEFSKLNIQKFILEIQTQSEKYLFHFTQIDNDFYTFLAKHILFFKYLYLGVQNEYYYKVLISDFYYFILSIIKNEIRYIYVNERSIIENYMRAIMKSKVEDNHVNEQLFKEMKLKQYYFNFSDDDYSLIKAEYTKSCGYIHGGDVLNDNLAFVFEECADEKMATADRTKYYKRVQDIIKVYDKLLISENATYISGCFHRKKSLLSYLVGKQSVELLFVALNN